MIAAEELSRIANKISIPKTIAYLLPRGDVYASRTRPFRNMRVSEIEGPVEEAIFLLPLGPSPRHEIPLLAQKAFNFLGQFSLLQFTPFTVELSPKTIRLSVRFSRPQ